MIKWLIIGYTLGFGIGLLITTILFETFLSPLGNPLIVNDVVVDWNTLISVWRMIGIGWIIIAVALFLFVQFRKPSKNR